jgi:hypothetical protein
LLKLVGVQDIRILNAAFAASHFNIYKTGKNGGNEYDLFAFHKHGIGEKPR